MSNQQSPTTLQQAQRQNRIFAILVICLASLVAGLSLKFNWQADLTFENRNTLTPATLLLLSKLDQPLSFTVYSTEDESIRRPIKELVTLYQKAKPEITFKFVDPEVNPQLVRENKITSDGELVIEYGKRSSHLHLHSELTYSNALQGLARNEDQWLIFIKGHGERQPHRQANFDLSDWVKMLSEKGFKSRALNLTTVLEIPSNTSVLVIAGPQTDYLSGEVEIIQRYLDQGENLLWLVDPGRLAQLDSIAKTLSIEFQAGVIVDPSSKLYGIDDPSFTIVPDYPAHPITDSFAIITLFPQARGINITPSKQWQTTEILRSVDRAWSETSELRGKIRFDSDKDSKGPITLGVAMTRDIAEDLSPPKKQRVVVIGDGDFISNTYLGNGGNIDMGLSIVNWLSRDDKLIDIPAKIAPDTHIILSSTYQAIIAIFFFVVLPLAMGGGGFIIWYIRRNKS